MPRKKRLTHDQKIIAALKKVKLPLVDKLRNLNIYLKERARSNEDGMEHIAKRYHNLDPTDIELLADTFKNPLAHTKDKRYPRTYCYYHRRKSDRNNFIKAVIKVESDLKTAYISSVFISSKIK